MKDKLDRIIVGSIDDTNLERQGKVCFKRHSDFEEIDYAGRSRYHHYIVGKLSNGEKVFDQSISSTLKKKDITKQKFLEEVNEDLSQLKGYLTEAEYSNPILGRQKVKGILYKEKV